MVGASVVFFTTVVTLAVRSQLRRPVTGAEGMIGETGEAMEDFTGEGKVYVLGEWWNARCSVPLRKGDKVTVAGREGMTLLVEPRNTRS
jgi:membrane-bound serine protease (ClpP class)